MDTYIVQVFRPAGPQSNELVGFAHRVGVTGRAMFRSFDELEAILKPRNGTSIWAASGSRPDEAAYAKFGRRKSDGEPERTEAQPAGQGSSSERGRPGFTVRWEDGA